MSPASRAKYFPDPPRSKTKPIAAPDRRLSGRPTVLLIDDDPAVRESLGRVLASEPLDVVTAAGGKDALDSVMKKEPDLIITDLCMAPLTGWDLLVHLRDHHPDLPILVITALAPESTGGADKFATDFFQKPLDLDALLSTIRRHLGISGPGLFPFTEA